MGLARREKLKGEDVLAAIKTVDGVESGLDADLLDGRHADELVGAAVQQAGQNAALGYYGKTEVDTKLAAKAAAKDLTDHTDNTTMHITAAEREKWNGKAAATDLTGHTDNTTVHITDEERNKWNNSASLSNLVDGDAVGSLHGVNAILDYQMGKNAVALGVYTTASANSSTALGSNTTASGRSSTALGSNTTASGSSATALGFNTTANASFSTALGSNTTASGSSSTALGYYTTASGDSSTALGIFTQANGYCSTALGSNTTADFLQTAIGKYNKKSDGATALEDSSGDIFIIGNGTKTDSTGNAFRVSTAGEVFGQAAYNSSGADYAEYFEWADGNPNNEDRRGLFVTLEGEKIRPASAADDYVLGIVSAYPAVLGDSASEEWRERYLTDVFGARLTETVNVPETVKVLAEADEETGQEEVTRVIPAHTETRWILNPDYDANKPYIRRADRAEWSPVGLVGKLVVVDDGTCQVNGYCAPGTGGIGTAAAGKTPYRVLARLDDTHIRVFVR